ncbi:MAG: ribose-phosphate diphosphokinase [Nanoarchaeota archaeon]|nr:ribose-phosphate diphosphokinase [Nanoarchaeota archaeon]
MKEEEVLILADPRGNVWNFAKSIYEKLNSNPDRLVKYHLREVNVTKFNDGEIFVNVEESVRNKICFFVHDSSMNPQDWAISLVEINDALIRSSIKEIHNVLPYMKYSRQDRMTEPRTPITSSVLAGMIGMMANGVITTDLHNPAITGAYSIPFDNLRAYPTIIDYLQNKYPDFLENLVIVAPDVGSAEMAKSYAKRLEADVAIAYKSREKAGVVGKMTLIGDVAGKNVIIVDDMIDTAGTLCKAAEVLKEKGALRIWACATHGLFSNNALERLDVSFFDKVIITNSIPQESLGKIEIVPLEDLFAETISRISHGRSVSELFR